MGSPRFFRSGIWILPTILLLAVSGYAQSNNANQAIKWDDYTYKFNSTGQMAQVLGPDGKVVGSILSMNGSLQILPLPGTDSDKIKKSFEDWKAFSARSHSSDSSATASAGASCPTTMTPYYLDGSSWKPMTVVVNAGRETGVSLKEGLKNPLNPMAGRTRIAQYKDPAATITLGPSPKFCLSLPASVNPEVLLIGTVDVKKDHRELEINHSDKIWMPQKRIQPIDVKRISDTMIEITLKSSLAPGQYVLGGPPVLNIYDFGVDAAKTP